MNENYILQMVGITKQFPGVLALDNVNLNIRKGMVHVIVGENGAGKSTLMKILSGIYKPDKGKILMNGEEVIIQNPIHALEKGISIIQQELPTIPEISIEKNFFLGKEPYRIFKWLIDDKKIHQEAEAILKHHRIDISADTRMKELSIAQKQIIEIVKAVSSNSKVIIMDEPTSAITENEVGRLFKIIEELKNEDVAVIYISHKMEEIDQIADDITIIRDGKYIGTWKKGDIDSNRIISLMVGRDLTQRYPKVTIPIGEEVLSVNDLTIDGSFKNISFNVKAGEILGIAGLMGSGRTEVARSIFGFDKLDSGEIRIHGKEVKITSTMEAIKNGMAMVTEDRRRYGVVLTRSICENISLVSLKRFVKFLAINKKKEKQEVKQIYDRFLIKSPDLETRTDLLSGGNQQKVVLAKWMLSKPDVLILDEPTRGIDVGAKFELYRFISEMAEEGLAIIFISSELPELLGMADRILVMCQGEMTTILDRSQANQEEIMKFAVGLEYMAR